MPEFKHGEWYDLADAYKDGRDILLLIVEPPGQFADMVGRPDGWVEIDIGARIRPGVDEFRHKKFGTATKWSPPPDIPNAAHGGCI